MKKRIISILLTSMMVLGLSACGNDATQVSSDLSSTPSSEESLVSDEVSEPSIDDGIVDEGTLGDVPDVEASSSINTWSTDIDNGIRWEYGDSAWLETYPLLDDPTLARNLTYFVNPNGNAISITWVGPNGMGSKGGVSPNGGTLNISSDDRYYRFDMWGGKISGDDDLSKNYDADTILSWWDGGVIANTFEVVEDTETTYSVLFEITYESDGISYRGYAYFIDYLDRKEYYQFAYLMEESIFDEEAALMVLDSIEYFEGLY